MMVPAALAAAGALTGAGVSVAVVSVPVIKPLDAATVCTVAAGVKALVTAENHTIIGGLGSAGAEAVAEAGPGPRLRPVGVPDTLAEGALGGPNPFGEVVP